jgi:hypothetical protein
MFHGMARLTELHSQLKALTAHSQAQQQLLQQERERQKAQQMEGSASAAAAAAAAAAAISGLGAGPQQHQQQERARDRSQQQQATGKASNNIEQRKLKGRQATAAHDAEHVQQTANAAAAEAAGATAALPVSEQLRLLQQQYQAVLLQLAGPVLSTLVLLADAAVATGEPHVVLGLQRWAHQGFYAAWETVSQLYSLDILAAAAVPSPEDDLQDLDDYLQVGAGSAAGGGKEGSTAGSSAGRQQQQQTASPSMLLLSWLPAAAAQAAGRYEDALQLYGSFLASEACSTGLGGATKPWVQEQMAACYAALADWQGLTDLCNAVRGFGQQQQVMQQQGTQEPTAVPWLQHWQLAGVVGVQYLQSWCMPGSAHEQQHRAGLQVIEQHLSGPGRGGRLGSRGRGSEQGQHTATLQNSSSEVLRQYRLDVQQGCGAAASQAALAVLHATAALELCASSTEAVGIAASSSSDGREGLQHLLQQAPGSPRGSAGRGCGHGRQGLLQPTAASLAAAAQQQQQELQQQLLMQAVTDMRQQLAALQSNPFVVLPGVCFVLDTNSSSLSTHSTLKQLSVMQLLQAQLLQSLQPGQQGQQGHQGASVDQVGYLLRCLSLLSDRDITTSSSNASSGSSSSGMAVDSVWSCGLQQDGRLAVSLFGDVASTTALLQVSRGSPAAGSGTDTHAVACFVAKTDSIVLWFRLRSMTHPLEASWHVDSKSLAEADGVAVCALLLAVSPGGWCSRQQQQHWQPRDQDSLAAAPAGSHAGKCCPWLQQYTAKAAAACNRRDPWLQRT